MVEYRRGRPGEEAAIIDHANLTFSHDHCPHDFPTLLPKLFSPENIVPEDHFLALEDGRIRACVGCYTNEQIICGHTLRSLDIGTVSVHPYARREGHMRKLMAMAMERMDEENTDLSWLGGLRQRYGYWGYEQTGTSVEFSFTRTNARHVFPGRQAAWELRPIGKDSPALAEAKALHDAQPCHFVREKFYDVLCTWKNQPFAFYDGENRFRGYAVTSKDGSSVPELFLTDNGDIYEALLSLLTRSEQLRLSFAYWRGDLIEKLYAVCENYSVHPLEQCRINRFGNVLNAALALRALAPDAARLPACSFAVSIPETNEKLLISWKDGHGEAVPTDALPDSALTLTRREAETLFFAPVTLAVRPLTLPAGAFPLLPLPLCIPSPDAV